MRLRADRIGALNVFQATPGALDEAAALAGQALADVATIAILQARAVEDAARLAGQVVEGSFTLDAERVVRLGLLPERLGVQLPGVLGSLPSRLRTVGVPKALLQPGRLLVQLLGAAVGG